MAEGRKPLMVAWARSYDEPRPASRARLLDQAVSTPGDDAMTSLRPITLASIFSLRRWGVGEALEVHGNLVTRPLARSFERS
jgi:hypothetical protein